MKIINIDAPLNLASKVNIGLYHFILDVIRPIERKYYYNQTNCDLIYYGRNRLSFPIWMFCEPSYKNVAYLLHTIPIYLRDSKPEKEGDFCIIDPLGAYFTSLNGNSPYIELYLKEIDHAANSKEKFKWLFTKVLLHELAHAALDIFNLENCPVSVEKVSYNTTFGRWREESMANAVALHIIKEYQDVAFYDYAKKIMLSQSKEYALGVKIQNLKHQFVFLSVFLGKMNGVDSVLQKDWINFVKGNPSLRRINYWNAKIYLNSGGDCRYKSIFY